MKFEIRKRQSAKVIFIAELSAEYENYNEGLKLGMAIKLALQADANLTRANLAGAYLAGANLTRANLTRADLTDADLAGANLTRADLTDAEKIEEKDIPVIQNIDAVILAEIERGGTLKMEEWHGLMEEWCGTTHCRGGWAVHCAGQPGRDLELKVGTLRAATMIYRASRQGVPAPWFFAPTDVALADIKKCAAEQTGATV